MTLKENKIIKNITIIINIIFCLIFPLSVVGAMISPMLFDSSGSAEDFYTNIFFYSTFSMPIVILISVVTSFLFLFRLKSYKKAFLFSLLPVINFTIIISFIFWVEIIYK